MGFNFKNVVKMERIASLPLFSVVYVGERMALFFDFDSIVPMPESLEMEGGYMERLAIEAALRNDVVLCRQFRQRKLVPPMTDEEYAGRLVYCDMSVPMLCEAGRQYIKNYALYGATNADGWRRQNWGTNCNSHRYEYICDDLIRFETVGGVPEFVIAQLARQHPHATIEHWWADDSEHGDIGYVTYQNGNVYEVQHYIYGDKNDETRAICWCDCNLLYLDQHGALKCRSCENG